MPPLIHPFYKDYSTPVFKKVQLENCCLVNMICVLKLIHLSLSHICSLPANMPVADMHAKRAQMNGVIHEGDFAVPDGEKGGTSNSVPRRYYANVASTRLARSS